LRLFRELNCRTSCGDGNSGKGGAVGNIYLQCSASLQVEEGARIVKSFILCLTVLL